MISQTSEYALRAAICLAAEPERPHTTPEIARAARVPPGYLAKVMQGLVREGLVRSRRGKGGGFLLAQDPRSLTVLAIVNAVDPIQRLHGCPLDLKEHARELCPLHQRLDDAAASVERILAGTSIASLLGTRKDRSPLCRPDREPRAARATPTIPKRTSRRS